MKREFSEQDPFTRFLIHNPARGRKVMALNRAGRKLLAAGRREEAEAKFRAALKICEYAIPALNNLALCAQAKGDPQLAIRTANRVLEYIPDNIFAHCTLAECYVELGKEQQAERHMRRALSSAGDTDFTLDKLEKIIEALAFLGWDEELYDLYLAYHDLTELDALSWLHFGVALANRDAEEEALLVWDRAQDELGIAGVYYESLELVRNGKAPRFRFPYWRNDLLNKEVNSFDELGEVAKPLLVVTVWNGETDEMRSQAVAALGRFNDPWAESFLRHILIQPELPDSLKLEAAGALVERGAIKVGDTVEMHINGKKRRVVLNEASIPSSPPPAAMEEFNRGLAHAEDGQMEEAEAAFRRAIEIAPYFAPAVIELANILRDSGRVEEAEEIVRQALAVDEDVFLLIYLAQLYLAKKDCAAAHEVISRVPADELAEANDSVYIVYLVARIRIALEEEDFETARKYSAQLLAIAPDHEEVAALLEWLRIAEDWSSWDEELVQRRWRRYLNRPVSPDMDLRTALGTLTKDNLMGTARSYGIRYSGMRKGELQAAIGDYIMAHVEEIAAGLSPEEREVVSHVIAAGGSSPLSPLVERYGDFSAEFEWRYEEPRTCLGRIQSRGILFVGTAEDGQIAFVPSDLRPRLQKALKKG